MKFKDITYMHEHITIDLSKEKNDLDCRLDDFEKTKKELINLKKMGVERIVDVTNCGMGRDVSYVLKMEKETGINIYMSTGYYKEPFLPKEVFELSEDELAEKMINDILYGIDNSEKKATFIGEIGTGFDNISESEMKVFKAAAIAHKKTGAFITTHTSLGKLAHEQLDLFESFGVDLNKVILGHVALANNYEYIEALVKRGANVEFDTIGKIKYLSDETRANFIKKLCDRGFENKILLSVDITRKSHLKENNGIGYSYLIDKFIPMLIKVGIEYDKIEKILVENPKKILGL